MAPISARALYNKAPAYAAPVYNWTGFYIGGHLGGAFSGSNNFNGAVLERLQRPRCSAAFRPALDWQFAPNWVLGTEGQYTWLGKNNLTATFPGGFVYNQRSARPRLDHRPASATPGVRAWLYVKGGYAYSDNSERVTFAGVPIAFIAQWQPQQRLDRRRRPRIHGSPRTGRPRASTCITISAAPAS